MPETVDDILSSYGDPRTRLRDPVRSAPVDPFPSLQPFPGRQPRSLEEGTAGRVQDPMAPPERPYKDAGSNLRKGNYGEALLNVLEMIAGGVPAFGKRGKGSGPTGSERPPGQAPGPGPQAGGVREPGGMGGGNRWVPPPSGPEHPYTPIPGQPATVKIPGHGEVEARPIPQLQEAARDVAHARGKDYVRAREMPPYDIERGKRIAQAYDEMLHDPTNPDVRRAYDALIEETLAQYKAATNKGVHALFNEPGQDPYARSPALGYTDMRDNGRLFVFPTIEGYGDRKGMISAEEIRNNPLLGYSGEKFGGKDATYNDLFRAVHDWMGHHREGNPFFRGPGEERAWGHHGLMYDKPALFAATSELRGQNNWLNLGPHGEYNKGKSGADTKYADQKIGIMPEWTAEQGLPPGIVVEPAPKKKRDD